MDTLGIRRLRVDRAALNLGRYFMLPGVFSPFLEFTSGYGKILPLAQGLQLPRLKVQ